MGAMPQIPPIACPVCGIPLDSQSFDVSAGIVGSLSGGRTHSLARFELPPRYCGVLDYFSQFTDQQAANSSAIDTPDFDWSILINGRPLAPYQRFNLILNPWGFGSFQTRIRLTESAIVEFVARQTRNSNVVSKIAGRLVGRYWYNTEYGDAVRAR